ncbi:NirD/YgiW/YdeI family stress tolerance protein [Xylophilus rhododendri]|uniref:NirD/YgiW/YdeI family stress tolerance protein n=1 Tax=Xylophilus rhododendri TaxID=2697032 RepID=A0A857J3D2_9BURK|nr:NirD/YgiW/YdeI family stress tolerance protein [Xylophilus rhododendri]QHI97561.1 NirD/YgiW/YdeI family stress tolerance protein [Xylophilus rhododendri]
MKLTIFACALAALMIASGSHAEGQAAVAAAPGTYVGPGGAALLTVRQLQDSGKDEQPARLKGRIVSHEQGKHYTFADDTGRMTVEISPRRFPDGVMLGADQWVEISGEVEKEWGQLKFKVKNLRLAS